MKPIQRSLIFALWLVPLFGVLQFITLGLKLDIFEFWWVLKNTFIQALGSTFATLIIGFIGSLGLLWFQKSRYSWFLSALEILLILPSVLPSLYIILACLQMIDPFPMGRVGVVFIHVMMNFGMISVILSQILRRRMSSISEVALTLGFGFWRFLVYGVLPMIKTDLMRLGFFIFSMSFVSFAVPLTVGGGRGTTLEVLIYEKIRMGTEWSVPLTLTLIQIVFLFVISLFISKVEFGENNKSNQVQIIPNIIGLILISALMVWLYGSFLLGFSEGLARFHEIIEMKETLLNAAINSYIISLAGGLIIGSSYLYLVFLWPDFWLEKFMNGIVAPSTVLVGFGLILFFQKINLQLEWLRLGLGFWILFFPTLVRWGGLSDLKLIENQIQSAMLLGASRWQIFYYISLPQLLNRATWLGGVGAFWIAGEFALSRIIMNQDKTLALIAESFISSYRLSLGTVLCMLMIICGMLSFLTIRGLGYVAHRKFKN